MKTLRTRYFKITLFTVLGLSALFLGFLLLFGRRLAVSNLSGVASPLLAVFALATASFLAFCFLPYFHGDRRWYVISGVLTLVFCFGAALLWQATGTVVTV